MKLQNGSGDKLSRLLVLFALTAGMAACGGGSGGGDSAAPPAGTPPAGSPPSTPAPPASDIATLADVLTCSYSPNIVKTTQWSTCLQGKRFIGKDKFSAAGCEFKLLANGTSELKLGAATYATAANATDGVYGNTIANGDGQLAGTLTNFSDSTEQHISDIKLIIATSKSNPTIPGLNEDSLEVTLKPGLTKINCSLNNI
jgi:hypothetical protein